MVRVETNNGVGGWIRLQNNWNSTWYLRMRAIELRQGVKNIPVILISQGSLECFLNR